jgi:hypothetical protein
VRTNTRVITADIDCPRANDIRVSADTQDLRLRSWRTAVGLGQKGDVMKNVFRLKAMTIMGHLCKIDGAEFSYRYEHGVGPIMEVYHKKEFHTFTPDRESFTDMDIFLQELVADKKENFLDASKATKMLPFEI